MVRGCDIIKFKNSICQTLCNINNIKIQFYCNDDVYVLIAIYQNKARILIIDTFNNLRI